jgi:prophage antirepressor-like protein
MIVVSESGLYVLIITSRKPRAKPLRHWITDKILGAVLQAGH